MTIDEKLQHFYDVSVEEARMDASSELEAHKKNLSEMLNEHMNTSRQNAAAQLKAETENSRREVNKALSAEQLTIKRNWTKKQNELKEKLFTEVRKRLDAFKSTPQYEDYLCSKIKQARNFAGDDELFIYLSPDDSALLSDLSRRVDFPLEISKDSFLGGIKATIPSKNILIDNSFLGNFTSIRKEFNFDGGRKHE